MPVEEGKRRCYACKEDKFYSEFNKGRKGPLKLRYSCRECDKRMKEEYRKSKGINTTGRKRKRRSNVISLKTKKPVLFTRAATVLSYEERLELIRDLAIEYRIEKDYAENMANILKEEDKLLLDERYYKFS